MKKRIGVDCDEVLYPTIEPCFREFLNCKYGIRLSSGDIVFYDLWRCYSVSRERAISDFHEFSFTERFRCMEPYHGAVNCVRELKAFGELFVVTSRAHSLTDFTKEVIVKHFPGVFSGIYFGNNYSLEGKSTSKQELCKLEGMDLLIDDCGETAVEVSQTIPVILFDKPWNRNVYEDGKRLFRARCHQEIVEMTRGLF